MSRRRAPRPAPAGARPAAAARGPRPAPPLSGRDWTWLLLLLVVTAAVLSPVLRAEYLNYDDDIYITQNPLVRQLDAQSVQTLFTTRYRNQYAPVAMVIMAAQYRWFRGSLPALRWVTILVHLANVLLLFVLLRLLFRNVPVAGIAAALFAVHPVQIESVAWLTASMKIGWYVLFSLGAMIAYVRYAGSRSPVLLLVSLLLFALSCLSKEQAVALVGTLPLVDYALRRDLRRASVWLEKLPFLALAIAIGSMTLGGAERQQGAGMLLVFGPGERALLACQAFASYLAKLAVPLQLSAFYTYPVRIEAIYGLAPLVVLAVLAGLVLAWRRDQRVIVFAIGFFLLHLGLSLLNLMFSLRDVLMADRYLYFACAGAFLLVGHAVHRLWQQAPRLRAALGIGLAVCGVGLGVAAHARAQVWRDSLTLFSDVIAKETATRGRDNPFLALAYNNRGVAHKDRGDLPAAMADFAEAIRINPRDARGYVNRGNYFFNRREYEQALPDYDRAIELDPREAVALTNRGGLLASIGRYEAALPDFDRAIEIDPGLLDALRGRAMLLHAQGRYDRALPDCDRYVAGSSSADAFGLRALVQQGLGRTREAEADFTHAIRLEPRNGSLYRDRAVFYAQIGDRARAGADARMAQSLGVPVDTTLTR